jgi:hypothetical protein
VFARPTPSAPSHLSHDGTDMLVLPQLTLDGSRVDCEEYVSKLALCKQTGSLNSQTMSDTDDCHKGMNAT